jgi:hypothetical protein
LKLNLLRLPIIIINNKAMEPILNGIVRLLDHRHRNDRHIFNVYGRDGDGGRRLPPIGRRSLEYLLMSFKKLQKLSYT